MSLTYLNFNFGDAQMEHALQRTQLIKFQYLIQRRSFGL